MELEAKSQEWFLPTVIIIIIAIIIIIIIIIILIKERKEDLEIRGFRK